MAPGTSGFVVQDTAATKTADYTPTTAARGWPAAGPRLARGWPAAGPPAGPRLARGWPAAGPRLEIHARQSQLVEIRLVDARPRAPAPTPDPASASAPAPAPAPAPANA
jgi:hypothetical protein